LTGNNSKPFSGCAALTPISAGAGGFARAGGRRRRERGALGGATFVVVC